MYKIYVVKREEDMEERIFLQWLSFVSESKRNRILRQRVRRNAENMLIGDILTRYAMKENFGIPMVNQHYKEDEKNKPYLEGRTGIYFNISHAKDCVACMVSTNPCGIDIQNITKFSAMTAKRFCSKDEWNSICASSNQDVEYTKIWTRKEAYLKAFGIGITGDIPLNELDTSKVISEVWNEYVISYYEMKV